MLGPPKDHFLDPVKFQLRPNFTPFKDDAGVYAASLKPHGIILDQCIVADALPRHLWIENTSTSPSKQKGGSPEDPNLSTDQYNLYQSYIHSVIDATSPEVICFCGQYSWIVGLYFHLSYYSSSRLTH